MLSPVKYQERLKNLSAIAQKVYSAVPASEPWSMTRIHAEMQRVGGTSRDQRIVHGCLNSLKDAGLIDEPERSVFVRVAVRPEKAKPTESATTKEEKPMPATAKPTQKPARDPVALFADLAARCRQLADDFELAGLEVGEQMAQQGKEAEQLQQLRKLLGSMG